MSRTTRKDLEIWFGHATQALEAAGVAPPDGHAWHLHVSMSYYALRVRDTSCGGLATVPGGPEVLGTTVKEAVTALQFVTATARAIRYAKEGVK